MKDIAIGCLAAILGLIVGIVLTFGVMSFLPKESSLDTTVPIPSTARGDVTVTVSASYLNAQIQQAVKQTGLAKQTTVSFVAPNSVNAALVVDANVAGRTVPLNATVALRVSARNGRIALTVDRVDADGVTLPAALSTQAVENMRAQAEEQLNRALQRALPGLSLRFVNVSVTPAEVTLQFKQ